MKKSSRVCFLSIFLTSFHSTIKFHLCIIETLSQILSTSDNIWVLKKTVVPDLYKSYIKSFTIFDQIASSQLIGSSRNTNLGLLIIAWAKPILWSIHFENSFK